MNESTDSSSSDSNINAESSTLDENSTVNNYRDDEHMNGEALCTSDHIDRVNSMNSGDN